jgi:hypothetical protein
LEKTASVFITARTKDLPDASRLTRMTPAPSIQSNSEGLFLRGGVPRMQEGNL